MNSFKFAHHFISIAIRKSKSFTMKFNSIQFKEKRIHLETWNFGNSYISEPRFLEHEILHTLILKQPLESINEKKSSIEMQYEFKGVWHQWSSNRFFRELLRSEREKKPLKSEEKTFKIDKLNKFQCGMLRCREKKNSFVWFYCRL